LALCFPFHKFDLILPVKQRLITTVKSILEFFDQVGLSWHPKETLLFQTLFPYEIHTLLHQERG